MDREAKREPGIQKSSAHIKSHQVLSQAYAGLITHTINFVLSLDKAQEIYKDRRL